MALRGEIVNFLRLDLVDQPCQRAGIAEIAVVQHQPVAGGVRVGVDMLQAARVEGTGAADDAMHLVALRQQQFRQIRTILASDSGNERFFHGQCNRGKVRELIVAPQAKLCRMTNATRAFDLCH